VSSSSSRCVCCLYSGLAVSMRGHWQQQYVLVSNNFPSGLALRRATFVDGKLSAPSAPSTQDVSSESMFDCTSIPHFNTSASLPSYAPQPSANRPSTVYNNHTAALANSLSFLTTYIDGTSLILAFPSHLYTSLWKVVYCVRPGRHKDDSIKLIQL